MHFQQITHNKQSLPQMQVSIQTSGAVMTLLGVLQQSEKPLKDIPGISRTPAQTIRTIKRQIWAACSGVQDIVDSLQTSTGVKDKTAIFWIDKLIIKAREIQQERFKSDPRLKDKNLKGSARKAIKTRIKDFIQWELYNWVIMQPEERYSKLSKHSGVYLHF
ncbi:hypothetical protein MSAN_00340200 [Mycena sanguinolenta]|uniref:Uncharacterized protein n=1 Tax=Mycena sanguinolenta TaxID=230812 RepID=A0A8H6ZE05_9AGAR|nr:hypothetical protein MSAN_00340200 [Mycena sanguinolenta]